MLMTVRSEPRVLGHGELAARVYRQARCAVSRVDPDEWFPVAQDADRARVEAAGAIAVCAACPVRPDCRVRSPPPAWSPRRCAPRWSAHGP